MSVTTDTAAALALIRPGAQWNLRGGVVEWLDAVQVQPTDTELQAGITQIKTQQTAQATAVSNAKTVLANAVSTPQQQIAALRTLLGI